MVRRLVVSSITSSLDELGRLFRRLSGSSATRPKEARHVPHVRKTLSRPALVCRGNGEVGFEPLESKRIWTRATEFESDVLAIFIVSQNASFVLGVRRLRSAFLYDDPTFCSPWPRTGAATDGESEAGEIHRPTECTPRTAGTFRTDTPEIKILTTAGDGHGIRNSAVVIVLVYDSSV